MRTVYFCYVNCAFEVNLLSVIARMSRNALLETGVISEIEVTATGLEPTTTYEKKELNL